MVQTDFSFFQGEDVVQIARNLLGKKISTNINKEFCSGIIVETEAYNGVFDKACHAYQNRFTKKTTVMYEPGGTVYVYLCYGIHYLLNIVTNKKGIPDAVLIRAIQPIEGVDKMVRRRNTNNLHNLGSGPGKLTKALGVNNLHNGTEVNKGIITIENMPDNNFSIVSSKRIGIDYAENHALLPWRFYIKDSPWISKK
ncbi:MAG: DNA-3-methyladenine glycosylase [Chitinophagaceae bacterium]|nr:MAG: DNA-3-methyladenine glycosylase [Chitinophagaceae bacterium]